MDAVISKNFRDDDPDIVNSLIIDTVPDELLEFSQLNVASCNLTNFADEINLAGASLPVANENLDPLFVNPNTSNPPNEDFSIADKDSPAIRLN